MGRPQWAIGGSVELRRCESVHRRRGIPHVTTAGTKPEADPPRQIVGTRSGAASAATSDLRVQNEIFEGALSAQRAGQTDEAASLYRQLLARAPNGPLAGQARTNLAVITARAIDNDGGAR